MSKPTTDFFTEELAQVYDERNRKLSKISDNLHFLTGLILKELPARSRILCVGAGTGAEILSLARIFPDWEFVALEPSLSMLEVCRDNLKEARVSNRCEFIHGYIEDLTNQENFDAVLSILVAHFVKKDKKLDFFRNMTDRLRNGGYFINAEISFDLESNEFPSMLKRWEEVQKLMGATPESLVNLPLQLKQMLSVISPEETEKLIKFSGINSPIQFFQAFMICGWYGIKI